MKNPIANNLLNLTLDLLPSLPLRSVAVKRRLTGRYSTFNQVKSLDCSTLSGAVQKESNSTELENGHTPRLHSERTIRSIAARCAMDKEQFVSSVVRLARASGYKIEINREGLTQIDFGNKKLHAKHLQSLFPAVLEEWANISALIEAVAPGRPCTHKPMKEIVSAIRLER